MTKPSARRLQTLDRFLGRADQSDDAMVLSEFDGFIAGVAVCPELLMPSEWLPVIWGEDGPVFDSERKAQGVLGAVMGHYNDVLRRLATPGRYAPLYDEDRDGSILWELWASGFGQAVELRPAAWQTLLGGEPEVRQAMAVMLSLVDLADRPGGAQDDQDRTLQAEAPDLIPGCLDVLHATRLTSRTPPEPIPTRSKSIGRNDPCPCGSGKKFKKCCLN